MEGDSPLLALPHLLLDADFVQTRFPFGYECRCFAHLQAAALHALQLAHGVAQKRGLACRRAVAPGAEFLFDRRVDPGENVNLVAREADEAERLRGLLDEYLAEGDAGVVEEGVRIDPGIAGRLRAMGYLR